MPGSRSAARPRAPPTLGGPCTRVSLATGRGIPEAHAIRAAVAPGPVARRSLSVLPRAALAPECCGRPKADSTPRLTSGGSTQAGVDLRDPRRVARETHRPPEI